MKKQIRVAFCAILVLFILAVLFVACDNGKSEGAVEKARGIAHKSEYYVALNKSEKTDFDAKLNDIIESEYFKNLDENGQTELVGKFVESEKTIKEIANDPKDKNPEDLDETTATQQEIKYWEIVKTVKEATENNLTFKIENPNTVIRRINGLYVYQGGFYFNADIIIEEVIDGKPFFSQQNVFCRSNEIATGEEEYDELIQLISIKNSIYQIDKICINRNSEEQKKYFEENKYQIVDWFKYLEEHDYRLTIEESWQIEGRVEYPEFIIKATKDDLLDYYMVTYGSSLSKYRTPDIYKICPEFWAQLEIERAKNNN